MDTPSGANPDPDPDTSPGLEPGGGVPPGSTPPAESSTSGAGPEERHNPTKGWRLWPLAVLCVVILACIGFFVARIAGL
ncbi:DUF6480 family protein [Streptomyces sp. NPDC059740]|uniref:DUF6480 family protein n=1 Tax=Streptomyces sp. NPDC059740 TaxID=3346926 RepID=UPI00366928C2